MSDLDNELLKVKDFKSVHGHQKKRFIKDKFFLQLLTTSDDVSINRCSTIGCLRLKNKIDTLFCPECRKGWVKYCIISGISGFDFLDDHDLSYFLKDFRERRVSL